MRADFVQLEIARAPQHGQADRADARIELGDPRTLRNLLPHVIDDGLRDLEIVLPEGTRRVMYRRFAEVLDHAGRSAPVLKLRAEDGVGAPEIGVEPQAMQLAAEAFADQLQALGQRLNGLAVGNEHHLCRLRAAFHDHLQVSGESQVGAVRVAGHSGINQGAPNHISDTIDEGVLNAAVRDVNHPMGTQLKQAHLRRAEPATDGKPRAMSKSGGLPGNYRHLGQAVDPRELIERAARA